MIQSTVFCFCGPGVGYSGEHELNIKLNNNTYDVLLSVLKNSGVKIECEK